MAAIKNILFITFDQWRGDCLSAMGHPVLETPKLDAFAKDAVLFRNHWSVTCPCGPGRTALLTGTYQHKNRSLRNGTPLDRRFTNVALEARKLNYDPALFGYTDISPDPRGENLRDPVFNTYEGILPGMTRICRLDDDFGSWFRDLRRKGYQIPENQWDIFKPTNLVDGKRYSYAPAPFKAEDSNAAFLTDSLLDYVEDQQDTPWFAHVTYISPHPPFVSPEPYNSRYDAADIPKPVKAASAEEEGAVHPWLKHRIDNHGKGANQGSGLVIGKDCFPAEMDEEETAQVRATYYGMINEVEDNFQRILDRLKETGAYDETLIVVTSDHGEQLGDHWMFSKTGFFDESYHVPLIIRDPRPEAAAARGRQIEAITESVDVMPTLLDLIGAPIPRQVDGYPLTKWLVGETPRTWRTEAHFEHDFGDPTVQTAEKALGLRTDECGLTVIRSDRYKYVHFTAMPPLFYDLQEDPQQLVNRAEDPAYRDAMLDMTQKMITWRMQTEDRDLSYFHIADGAQELADDRYEGL